MRLLLVLVLTAAISIAANAQQSLAPGNAAPVFALAGMDGQTYDLNQLRGKVVLVTFWSTKCQICHSEIPKLNQLAARYKGKDVVFLGLTMENETRVSMYINRSPFEFTIVPNSFGVVLQYADRDRQGNINMGFPAYFLVDQGGNIQSKTSGWDKTQGLDSQITRLLSARDLVAGSGSAGK